jgi:hypothetical protein
MAAPITLYLVATRLAPAEQGLYFVFVNVQVIAQLFEVGVGSLIVQYASHELPHLLWQTRGAIEGEAGVRTRVEWLLRRAGRWYVNAGLLFCVLALPLGMVLFTARSEPDGPDFARPWVATVLCTALYLPLIPLLSMIEGAGRLIPVQRMRIGQAVASALIAWVLIPTAGGLVAVATLAALQLAIVILWLWRYYPELVASWWRAVTTAGEGAPQRIIDALPPTQTRTALGWIGGHIALQALTPLVLFYQGASAAGQVGLTLAITIVPFTFGMSWLQGRFPEYGALVSQRERTSLGRLAWRATLHGATVCVAASVAATTLVATLDRFSPALRARFLPTWAVAAMGFAMLATLLVQAMAGYLRAYRGEPLLPALLCGYGAMLMAGWFGAARLGASEATIAYAVACCLVALPLVTLAFRHELHSLEAHAAAEAQIGS